MPIIPLGLCLVASALNKAGHQIKVLDLCFSEDPAAEIRHAVNDFYPLMVGVSIRNIDTCNGFQPHFLIDDTLHDVIEPLKAAFTGPIVLGGAAAGINGQALLDYFGLDFAVQGDGEAAMVEIASRLEHGLPLENCAGMVVRTARGLRQNPANFIDNIDELAFSRPQDWLDLAEYRAYGSPFSIQAKRGCVLKCSYCTYNRIEGCSYRLRSPQLIAQEITDFVAATGYRRVEFVDSTFNVPLEHAKAVLREIINLKLGLNLSTMGLNPRFVDQELVKLMKESGFTEISLGVEAGCDTTLLGLGKNFTVADIKKAGKLLKESKIPTMWYLLLGAPGETTQTIRTTIRTIGKAVGRWDIVNIGVGLRAYEGSPIANQMAADDQRRAKIGFFHPVAFEPVGISIPEIKRLASIACGLRHNFLMFDDGANINPDFAKNFTRRFPQQPIWRAYVVSRFIANFFAINLIQAAVAVILAPLVRRSLQRRHRAAMALDQRP